MRTVTEKVLSEEVIAARVAAVRKAKLDAFARSKGSSVPALSLEELDRVLPPVQCARFRTRLASEEKRTVSLPDRLVAILDRAAEPLRMAEIVASAGYSRSSVGSAVAELLKAGRVNVCRRKVTIRSSFGCPFVPHYSTARTGQCGNHEESPR